MNRRLFARSLMQVAVAPIAAASITDEPVRHAVYDSRHSVEGCFPPDVYLITGKSYSIKLDGREIRSVIGFDTASGLVKTLDVFPDAPIDPLRIRATITEKDKYMQRSYDDGTIVDITPRWKSTDFPCREVLCVPRDVLVETLRGHVQVFDADGKLVYGKP